jgi:hypothetical protein
MATETTPEDLKPRDFTEQRNDALREGVKGLLVINGGGATAMPGVLAGHLGNEAPNRPYVVGCIAFPAFGLFLAGLVQFFRYIRLRLHFKADDRWPSRDVGFYI